MYTISILPRQLRFFLSIHEPTQFEKFIDFYSDGYEIYKEVPATGIVDFVAKHGNITIAVEVKKSLNFEVIRQAETNKNYFNYSYIAIPKTKRKHFGHTICQRFGIGVLTYNIQYDHVSEIIKPKLNRNIFNVEFKEYMKNSIAGSQNNRITAFKNTIDIMAQYIKRHPECTLKECLENIDHHYNSISSAKSCITSWIKNGIIKNFYIKNNKLYLSDNN